MMYAISGNYAEYKFWNISKDDNVGNCLKHSIDNGAHISEQKSMLTKEICSFINTKDFADTYQSKLGCDNYQNLFEYSQLIKFKNVSDPPQFTTSQYRELDFDSYKKLAIKELTLEEIPTVQDALNMTREEFLQKTQEIYDKFISMDNLQGYEDAKIKNKQDFIERRLEYTGCKDEKELSIFENLCNTVEGLHKSADRNMLEVQIFHQAYSGYVQMLNSASIYPINGVLEESRCPVSLSDTLSNMSIEELAQWDFTSAGDEMHQSTNSLKALKKFISGTILTSSNLDAETKTSWTQFYDLSEQYADKIQELCEQTDNKLYDELCKDREKQEKAEQDTITTEEKQKNIIKFNQSKIDAYAS